MSQMKFFVNLSPLDTVVSRKVIWLILWYFNREFESRVEIVSSFNEPIYLFSVGLVSVVWFRFVGLISFQFPPWKYRQMTLLFSYPKQFHVFGGSSPQWIKTNFLWGLSQAFPWGSALGSVRHDWGTFRMFLILHSHLRHNYSLVDHLCSLNRCYEARHHLVVRLKTFECFQLLICTITCLQN